MTSEDKYVLSQLTNETGNLKGILKQQNKIENMATSMLEIGRASCRERM